MTTRSLVEHARTELERSGQTAEDPGYAASLIAAIAAFASYGHSGGSASVAIEQLNTLLQRRTLSPITSDPDEWEDRTEISGSPLWQNRRDSAAFSTDAGQTWHFVDDRIVGALEKLDPDSRSRVVAWLADRYRYELDMPDLIRVQEGS